MRNTRLSVALLAAVAVAATACKTDITGLNANPNSPTSAPPGTLFTNATANAIGRIGGVTWQLSGTELLAQHIAQVQYVDEDRFVYRSANINAYWNPYASELMDLQKVVEAGNLAKDASMSGPAKVLQTFVFQAMTDMWGDIPYSETLQGGNGPVKPKYDAQQDIYTGMLKTLTDASAAMGSGSGLGSSDPIYVGDATKWKKFANSLRARLAMRIQKADATKADAELKAAFAAGGFLSNADNAQLTWPGDGTFDNPWAANFAGRDDHRVSKTLLDIMNGLNDPRVKIYAQPAGTGVAYTGLQNGLNSATAAPFIPLTSRPGVIFYPGTTTYGSYGGSAGKKTATNLMTFAELSFIQAEAANRGIGGLTSGQAVAFYNTAVTASITQWGGSAAEAAAYLAQPAVAYAGGAAGLTQIMTQKWIALFAQGEEAWSDWRRTGVPSTIAPGPKATLSYIPRRLVYPASEQSVNLDNLNAAIARQGPNNMATRMWWDKP